MKKNTRMAMPITVALLTIGMLSCSSDLGKQNGPLIMLVDVTQNIHRIDIENGATGCDTQLGTVSVRTQNIQGSQNIPVDNTFNEVRLISYRISYVRTDGGTQVPAPFVRTISGSVGALATQINDVIAFQLDAFNQAPFAALQPQNGGRDPETGKPFVQFDVILEVFGETLAGERVSGSARVPLDVCYHCNGCA